jgi:hypothetical protein
MYIPDMFLSCIPFKINEFQLARLETIIFIIFKLSIFIMLIKLNKFTNSIVKLRLFICPIEFEDINIKKFYLFIQTNK